MAKITKVEQTLPTIKEKKKVAAYARVSMESERMNHSLSAQISYYSSLIQKNPDWQYAGVFADDGVSGTGTAKRSEFRRMIETAENGEIDIILTKSIQRFARNTVDLLETVRHLKDIGVEVRFEKEHINSMSGDGELMLTILASFAQEESRSISENVKWGTRKRFEKGIPNGKFRVYGYRWEGDELVIVPEEAKIVRRIFQNFLDGKSRLETEREFAAEGITTREGCRWVDSNIKVVLTNITYTGNLLLQKEFIADPISKQRKKNHGELPQYYVEDTHPAIIDKATFDYVQSEIARRKELGCFANKALNLSCFSTKIKCGNCGRSYVRSARKRGKYVLWTCGSKKGRRKLSCGAKDVPEEQLKRICCDVLGLDEFDANIFSERIEQVRIIGTDTMEFHFYDGSSIETKWKTTAKRDMWTPERKALWSEYNYDGGGNGTGMGFNEYVKRKEGKMHDTKKSDDNSANDQPLHGGTN